MAYYSKWYLGRGKNFFMGISMFSHCPNAVGILLFLF